MNDSLELLYKMKLIRDVEQEIADRYPEQKMRCPTHLSIGQEGPAAAVGLALQKTDYAISTHRGHAHYIAKGGSVPRMIAELYGKESGCARGRGGSMHLIDQSVNFMGTTAIVGNSIPIGVGLGLSSKLKGTNQISCVFLGDGASEEGSFYESINFAIVRSLPVLFLCENNLYSVYSPLSVRQPKNRKIFKMVEAMGIESFHGDGNDALSSFNLLSDVVSGIRSSSQPAFVELDTYRWREHCGPNFDNDIGYRSINEFETWRERDPIPKLQNNLISKGLLDAETLNAMENTISALVENSFDFAEKAPFPIPESASTDEYFSKLGSIDTRYS